MIENRWRIVFGSCFVLGLVWVSFGLIAKQGRGPSVLIVPIEHVSPESFECNPDEWPLEMDEIEAIKALCRELVRFNRVYTSSTLSAPAMGSLLSGLYPYETGFRHVGAGPAGHLKDSIDTVSEVAFRRGYRTAMWTSSPTLQRRHGLAQGFEIFDDFYPFQNEGVFRSARRQLRLFQRWLAKHDSTEPFFAVLHFSDLLFRSFALSEDEGYVEPTVQRKVAEVWSAIAKLSRTLRSKQMWDETFVVIVGLGGEPDRFDREYGLTQSLTTEATRVPLYIKPANWAAQSKAQFVIGRPRFEWAPIEKVRSELTSPVDIGATVIELLNIQNEMPSERAQQEPTEHRSQPPTPFKARSLLYQLTREASRQSEREAEPQRQILSESAWMNWLLDGRLAIRAAVRSQFYTAIFDQPTTVFEPSTDPFEASPVLFSDQRAQRFASKVSSDLSQIGFSQFEISKSDRSLVRDLVDLETLASEVLPEVIKLGLLERMAPNRTQQVSASGVPSRSADLVQQMAFPQSALGTDRIKRCRAGLSVKNPERELDRKTISECGGAIYSDMRAWYQSSEDGERSKIIDRIANFVRQAESGIVLAELGLARGVRWEVGPRLKQGSESWEILLSAPESMRLRLAVMRRLRAHAPRRSEP